MASRMIAVRSGEGQCFMLLHVIAAAVCVYWGKKNSNSKRLLKNTQIRLFMNFLDSVPSGLC